MLALYHVAELILYIALYIAAPVLGVIAWCVAAAATRFIPNQPRRKRSE